MVNQPAYEVFTNITQRSVSSYIKSLVDLKNILMEDDDVSTQQSQHDLYAFFQALYTKLYSSPERFGLPTSPDASIAEDEPDEKGKKQVVKRLLDKPRRMIAAGLDFLMQAGIQGELEGDVLHLENYSEILKQSKVKKKFLAGLLDKTGLVISITDDDRAILTNLSFAAMMPTLQILATSCMAYHDKAMGKFLFSSCDFRALSGYQLQAQDLYQVFDGLDHERVLELHTYFSNKNYKTMVEIDAPFAWCVKYQGNRKIKSTPLFQVEYEERYARSLRMQIKCASATRLASLLPKQPQLLQDDFARRAVICSGDECNWCRNRKALGPVMVEYRDEPRTVCWYTVPDVYELDDNTVELICQYEQMHTELLLKN